MIIPLRSIRFFEDAHLPAGVEKGGLGTPLQAPLDHKMAFDTDSRLALIVHKSNYNVPPSLIGAENIRFMLPAMPGDYEDESDTRAVRGSMFPEGRGFTPEDMRPVAPPPAPPATEPDGSSSSEATGATGPAAPTTSPETPAARTVVISKDPKTGKAKGKLDVGGADED